MKNYKTLFITCLVVFICSVWTYLQAAIAWLAAGSDENFLAWIFIVAIFGIILSLAGMITLSVLEIRANKKNDKTNRNETDKHD